MKMRAFGFLVAVLSAVVAMAQVPPVYNLPNQIGPLFDDLNNGGVGSVVLMGDSIMYRVQYITAAYNDYAADYGAFSKGYRGGNADFKWLPDLKVAFGGDLINNVAKSTSNGARDVTWGNYTVDGFYTRVRLDGYVTYTMPVGTKYFHYLAFPGGGTIKIERSGVLKATINADTGPGGVTEDRIYSGLPVNAGAYKCYSDGASWVQINGIETDTGISGIVFHRCARGGDGPRDFNRARTASTAAMLASLNPDLIWIDFDWVGNNEFNTYYTDMNLWLDFIHEAVPNAGIILSTHHSVDSPTNIGLQPPILYQIAQERNIGFVNHQVLFDANGDPDPMTNQELLDLGYVMPDGVHFTTLGGEFFAGYDKALLEFAYSCMVDWDQNGVLNELDLIAFMNDYNLGQADFNSDGTTDEQDAFDFDAAFAAGC